VSFWIRNGPVAYLPWQSWASGATSWFAPAGSGDHAGDTSGGEFTEAGSESFGAVPLLAGVDVTTPAVQSGGATISPGEPTVVVAGNNVIDADSSDARPDALNDPSQRLAGQVAGLPLAAGYGLADAGVESNQIMANSLGAGGVSLLDRMDRDVLAEPDVGTVIIDEGLQDVVNGAAAKRLDDAYTALNSQLTQFGINVILGDLTPCSALPGQAPGADACSRRAALQRDQVNSFIDGGEGGIDLIPPPCIAGFAGAVSDKASPQALAPAFGVGDDVNLSLGPRGGYAAIARALSSPDYGCPLSPSTWSKGASS
jgi:hypothetical protein